MLQQGMVQLQEASKAVLDSAKERYGQYFRTVPVTKRTQFTLYTAAAEGEFGAPFWRSICSFPLQSTVKAHQKRVDGIADRLIPASLPLLDNSSVAFEFRVISSNAFNAFCMPGGKVIVYSKVFEMVKDDDELAFVLAHEMSHTIARHWGEGVTREQFRKQGLEIPQSLASWASREGVWNGVISTNILRKLDQGSLVVMTLPHSRDMEAEADKIAVTVMLQAGFRPEAAVGLWQRLADSKGSADSRFSQWIQGFLSHHPSELSRGESLKQYIDAVRAESKAKP